jgi:hypothetical protein
MNNEPIKFLPVDRFWEAPKRMSDTMAVCLGVIAGALCTAGIAILFILASQPH